MSDLLETRRLLLRPFEPTDVENLLVLDGDGDVMRYLTGGVPTSRETIEAEVLPGFLAPRGRMRTWAWAAIECQSSAFAGWFSLRPPDDRNSEAELGFRLRKQFWNKGLGSEGASHLVDAGFTRFGLERIYAQTMHVNAASRRVMEKAGLIFVRRFHLQWDAPIDGAEHGEVEYVLTRMEWERGRSARPHRV
jgi:RimJ/RimL family protein N-acetyltransferase